MDNTKLQTRTAVEVFSDVEDITIDLMGLSDMLQMLIESTKLDQRDWTQDDEYDFIRSRDRVYNIIDLVSRRLWDMNKAIDNIPLKKAQDVTASTDQSN